MSNLDSILKSRDNILPTKVHLVKAMVFPVVMYGCESWTIKKAEHQRIDAFELWCWRRLLRVPWSARRSNQSILKAIGPEYSLKGLMLKLKLQYFGHLMRRTDSLEKTRILGGIGGRRRRGRQRMRWLDGITDSMDESQWTPGGHSNSCPLCRWCHPASSSSVVPFSSCPQSLPASESFPMSQHFAGGGQSTGVSALAYSFQRNPRADLLQNGLVGSPCSPRDCQESSPTPQFKSINSSVLSLLHSPSLIHTWPQWFRSPLKNKVWHCFHCFPIYSPWSDGTRCHDLSFLNVEL